MSAPTSQPPTGRPNESSSPDCAGEGQFPLAAQIPLDSFTLPMFPPAASHLRALTLTSDINLNEYQETHLRPGTFEPCTTLPSSITHLTLELFSLGFPAPFLGTLAKALPNLRSLTLFSCLIDGLDEASRKDALGFFQAIAPTLNELHVVDSFARVGFWKSVGESFIATTHSTSAINGPQDDHGLKILEVSYTYRGHHESDFLNRVAGEEWATFLTLPSLVGSSLNFESPPTAEQEAEEARMRAENAEAEQDLKAGDGILPFASDGRANVAVRKAFEGLSGGQKSELKVLNLSMYSLRAHEVVEIAAACAGTGKEDKELVSLTVSVLLEDGWFDKLIEALSNKKMAGSSLEVLEIVGVPAGGSEDSANASTDVEKLLMKSEEGIKKLSQVCGKLGRLEMSVLKSRRIGEVIWTKEKEKWNMQRVTRTTE